MDPGFPDVPGFPRGPGAPGAPGDPDKPAGPRSPLGPAEPVGPTGPVNYLYIKLYHKQNNNPQACHRNHKTSNQWHVNCDDITERRVEKMNGKYKFQKSRERIGGKDEMDSLSSNSSQWLIYIT